MVQTTSTTWAPPESCLNLLATHYAGQERLPEETGMSSLPIHDFFASGGTDSNLSRPSSSRDRSCKSPPNEHYSSERSTYPTTLREGDNCGDLATFCHSTVARIAGCRHSCCRADSKNRIQVTPDFCHSISGSVGTFAQPHKYVRCASQFCLHM